jgi:penicillin-binding protein 2
MRSAPADELLLKRVRLLQWLVFAGIGILGGRLYFLQIVSHAEFAAKVQSQQVKIVRDEAPRGLIRDRDGRLLVGNRRSYELVADLDTVRDDSAVAGLVAQVTGEPVEEIEAKLSEARESARTHRVTLARNLMFSMVAFVEARREDAPGLSVESRQVRQYPHEALAAHALGYLGEVNRSHLDDPNYSDYHVMGDQIGRTGLEFQHDRLLTGERGVRSVVRDVVGREISSTIDEPAKRGDDLELTLDLAVQQAAERALAGRRGALVMLDVRDGGVIALASAPAHEPSAFVGGISTLRWKELQDHPARPLNFRAVTGRYPPGSIWKPLVAAAALQAGVRKPSDKTFCGGEIRIHGQTKHCWKEEGHGLIDLETALVKSCNIYFYVAAKELGLDPIYELADAAGVGRKTGIDLTEEKSGILPGHAWKRKRYEQPWYPGDTINLSIGQGYLTVTPLQAAAYTMAIANGGTAWKPHLLRRATDSRTGEVVTEARPEAAAEVKFEPAALRFLHQAMTRTVDEGTGRRSRLPGIKVAGKTGTAQSVALPPEGADLEERALVEKEHAWFMGFAPADDPQVAFAVLVEHAGGHGGAIAAPIAREALEAYFAADTPSGVGQ